MSSQLPYPSTSYQPQDTSLPFADRSRAPPAPPPKPNNSSSNSNSSSSSSSSSQHMSRDNTSAAAHSQSIPPPPPLVGATPGGASEHQQARLREAARVIQDPGEQWLPRVLEHKSKQDLAEVLAKPERLNALVHSTSTSHTSTTAAQEPLQYAVQENLKLASRLKEAETRLVHLRSSTQARLLAAHALERLWRQKQSEMDRALAPSAPSSLYQRLSQGVQEQEMVCRALEESFLEGDGGIASEREVTEWVRRYREAKKVYYSRKERKERWDEGRVGGW